MHPIQRQRQAHTIQSTGSTSTYQQVPNYLRELSIASRNISKTKVALKQVRLNN